MDVCTEFLKEIVSNPAHKRALKENKAIADTLSCVERHIQQPKGKPVRIKEDKEAQKAKRPSHTDQQLEEARVEDNQPTTKEPPRGKQLKREDLYDHKLLVKCIRELKFCGKGLQSGRPLSSSTTGVRVKDFREIWTLDYKPCIEVSREELAALALALGMRLVMKEDPISLYGTGPFGIYLRGSPAPTDTLWRLHITHQHRQSDHEASKGSGYSILFAKHMACGCLPFGQSDNLIHSVCVDKSALVGIKEGDDISGHELQSPPPPVKYLSRLPAARRPRIYGTVKREGSTGGEKE